MDRVRIREKRRVFDDIFKIDEAVVELRRPDGAWTDPHRELCFERGDSVAALLVKRESGQLVLVRQFRYPAYDKGPGWLTEIVAGGLRAEESPETAIIREVREETGYDIESLEPIATFYVSPGGTSERVLLYYGEVGEAPVASAGEKLGVGDEEIERVEMSVDDLWESFRSGALQDGKTIVALMWLLLRRRGHGRPIAGGGGQLG